MIVLDQITLDEYKTKTIANMLKAIGADKKALIVLPEREQQGGCFRSKHPGREDRPGQHPERLRHPQRRQVYRCKGRRRSD